MQVIHLPYPVKSNIIPSKIILVLGFFDGVHLGHQHLITVAKDIAQEKKLPLAVMTFDRHAREVYANKFNFKYIDTIDEKAEKMANLGVDYLLIAPFTEGFSKISGQEFVDNVIVVWCAKSPGSQNVRVVGFYQHATVFRYHQWVYFSDGYEQCYEFVAEAKDCVLLPYQVRHSDSKWYVPTSSRNKAAFGLGRSSIWYAGSGDADEAEINYVERMIQSIEGYSGENWMERENAK